MSMPEALALSRSCYDVPNAAIQALPSAPTPGKRLFGREDTGAGANWPMSEQALRAATDLMPSVIFRAISRFLDAAGHGQYRGCIWIKRSDHAEAPKR